MPLSQIVSASIEDGAVAPVDLSSVAQYTGFKNRIINGAMVIDQRNAGASVTPTNNQYLVDRWQAQLTQASKFTAQQNAASVTPPVGFTNYLGVTSSSAYSVLTADVFNVQQSIEGLNAADLGFGTANAATVTLSFWVRSSLTGTFGGALTNSAGTRSYPFSYTINSANTWEKETITITGDTSGTWLTTNGIGITVRFSLGAGATYSGTAGAWAGSNLFSATGATSVVGTNGATFYITGVQLEKGVTATSFDYRPYGTELSLCQRYCYVWYPAGGVNEPLPGVNLATTQSYATIIFPVPLRSSVTSITVTNPTSIAVVNSAGTQFQATSIVFVLSGAGSTSFYANIATASLVAGYGSIMFNNNATLPRIVFNGAEL